MSIRRLHIDIVIRSTWQVWPIYERLKPGFQLYLPFLRIIAYWDGPT